KKIWKFTGYGNYSDVYGWDNGVNLSIEDEVSLSDALEMQNSAVEYSRVFNSYALPEQPTAGVYTVFCNEHGGSRNLWGFVVASSRVEAERLLRQDKVRVNEGLTE
ncbi:MAG: hypothetical protein JRJ62_15800, partial [Deltaproteobacteria bacterium]|nr:hypothetical protein [Deltaproteobacteria bacterium]